MRRLPVLVLLLGLLTGGIRAEPLVTLIARKQPLREIIDRIARQAGVRIDNDIAGYYEGSCRFQQLTVSECLDALAFERYRWEQLGPGHFRVWTPQEVPPSLKFRTPVSLASLQKAGPHELEKLCQDPHVLRGAIESGNLELVCGLLRLGASTSTPCTDGQLPSWTAVIHNCPRILAKLIERGAPIQWENHRQYRNFLILQNLSKPVLMVLVAAGADFNVADETGDSILHQPQQFSDHPEFLLTLDCAIDSPNKYGATPLRLAVARSPSQVAYCQGLVLKGADWEFSRGMSSPLEVAAAMNPPVLRFLLEQGADPNFVGQEGRSLLHLAVRGQQAESVVLLLSQGAKLEQEDSRGQNPLGLLDNQLEDTQRAILQYSPKTCQDAAPNYRLVAKTLIFRQFLVGLGVDAKPRDPSAALPADGGITLLRRALLAGDQSAFEGLLAKGATVEIPDYSLVALACELRQWDNAYRLIDQGADPNGQDPNGFHPLDHAVGSPVALKRLLQLGADPNLYGGGWTPLLQACWVGDTESLRSLLIYGADPQAKTGDGESAADLLKKNSVPNSQAVLDTLSQAERLAKLGQRR